MTSEILRAGATKRDLLRRAATLMRQRAQAATPGPWRFTDSEATNDVWIDGLAVVNRDADPVAVVADEWYEKDEGEPTPLHDAQHIASWHPAVALDTADLLETIAKDCGTSSLAFHAALAVARTYLDEHVEVAAQPCPECRSGKHPNCDGQTWDYERDESAPCPCAGSGHS